MVYRRFIKRILDFLMAIVLFVSLFIPMCIVSLAIKLTSKGPIFFIQERYGRIHDHLNYINSFNVRHRTRNI